MPSAETPRASEQATLATALLQQGLRPKEVQERLVAAFGVSERRARQVMAAARKAAKAAGVTLGPAPPPVVQRGPVDHPPPPDDVLAGVDWLMARAIAATDALIRTGDLTPRQELDVLHRTMRACGSLLNPERLYKAEQKIDKHHRKLGRPKKEEGLTDAGPVEAQSNHADPGSDGGNLYLPAGRDRHRR